VPQHLNYFFPYSGDVAQFEISLTRAFFALLNLCPVVHAHLIEMVRERNSELPAFFDLQPQSFGLALEVSSLDAAEGDAALVHLTGVGSPPAAPTNITQTDAGRRYDAVLTYDCGWAILFEAKIGAADQKDATTNIPHNLRGCIAKISWNDLIEAIWRLIECGLLRDTEEKLARQFLEYVETKFERLCPYSTLARCDSSVTRVGARCTQILRGIGPADGDRLDLGPEVARFGYLVYNSEKHFVALRLYPADTIAQAQKFYTPRHVEGTLRLRDLDRWSVDPNLHLAFMNKNLVWTQVGITLAEYLHLWLERMPRHGQTAARDQEKSGFTAAFNELVNSRLASDELDRTAFAQHFVTANRITMNICPGVFAEYRWPLTEAEKLDSQGRFSSEVRVRLLEALAAWGQTLPTQP
jgi:hypothetical protein